MTFTVETATDRDHHLLAAMDATRSELHAVDEALSRAQGKVANLQMALENSRLIGMALGIIIERCHVSPDQAFDLLVSTSQHTHRKLRDIASDLVYTGVIPDAAAS